MRFFNLGGLEVPIPGGWRLLEKWGDYTWRFISTDQLLLLVDETEHDGQVWRHVSISRQRALPSYQDLVRAKNDFIGEEFEAYQVFPRASKHVNIHPFCLHLYSPRTHNPLPDFTRGTGSI